MARRMSLVLTVALLGLAGTAVAGNKSPPPPSKHGKAPEFDPASAGAALTLLAGGALVIAGRRRRSS